MALAGAATSPAGVDDAAFDTKFLALCKRAGLKCSPKLNIKRAVRAYLIAMSWMPVLRQNNPQVEEALFMLAAMGKLQFPGRLRGRPRRSDFDRAFDALHLDALYRLGVSLCHKRSIQRPSQERAILEALKEVKKHSPTRAEARALGRRLAEARQYLRTGNPIIHKVRRAAGRYHRKHYSPS